VRYLLDTCLLSEFIKETPNPKVSEWMLAVDENQCYLSVLTFGEIMRGICKLEASTKKNNLMNWLEDDLYKKFSGRILEIDQEIAEKWGQITVLREKKGKPLPTIDGLLAASAMTHGLTLVTRNVKDFIELPLELFNPFAE
jgi:predicted nucleic acid-binding protein